MYTEIFYCLDLLQVYYRHRYVLNITLYDVVEIESMISHGTYGYISCLLTHFCGGNRRHHENLFGITMEVPQDRGTPNHSKSDSLGKKQSYVQNGVPHVGKSPCSIVERHEQM